MKLKYENGSMLGYPKIEKQGDSVIQADETDFLCNTGCSWLSVFPSVILLIFLMIVPLLLLSIRAFEGGSINENLQRLFEVPLYFQVLKNTLIIAFSVACCSLLLALPIYLLLIICSGGTRKFILTASTISMFMSILLRSFVWMILLSRGGFASKIAEFLRLIPNGQGLLFTPFSVITGMVHILMPYAILVMWSLKGAQGVSYWNLSRRLGSGAFYSYKKIILPQIIPEMIISWVIIFVLSLGFYITPELLGGGGGSTMMMGVLINEQVSELGEWGFGSLLSLLLVISTLLFLGFGWIIYKRCRMVWKERN